MSGASRGRVWIEALAGATNVASSRPPSVLSARALLGTEPVQYITVAPDAYARFPRAREGEVGVEEGWALAAHVRGIIRADAGVLRKQAIVAIVDVPSQAYGRREEQLGIHLALAAAVDAYATARIAGHPIIALLVGKAMSGAFLAHGYQANRIVALNDAGVQVQAMGKQAAARITRRTLEEVDALGDAAPPMSYRVDMFARFGLVDVLLDGVAADTPGPTDVKRVQDVLAAQISALRASGACDLRSRRDGALGARHASLEVRRRLAAEWSDADSASHL